MLLTIKVGRCQSVVMIKYSDRDLPCTVQPTIFSTSTRVLTYARITQSSLGVNSGP